MILVDIGNRFAHVYSDGRVKSYEHAYFLEHFKDKKLYFINVNQSLIEKINECPNWINLEEYIKLEGTYDGMGIDRKVLLLSRGDGIYIDAGSAITIDKRENNRFSGGTILPGIWIQKEAFAKISPVLSIDTLINVDIENLPKIDTLTAVSYGIIAPIIALIQKINSTNLPLYFCGGDGELLSQYMQGAIFDEKLVFEGMLKVIKESGC